MDTPLRTVLFGIGGFAANYLRAFEMPERKNVSLVGAYDPYASGCPLCPLFEDPERMLLETGPDIAIIATPIQFHAQQAVLAFSHGCHVVLEKPLAADEAGARQVLDARDKAGKLLNVNYLMCYDPVIRALKADADKGLFGRPVSLKAIVLWPRDVSYFRRGSGWAGKKTDPQGRPVFDSVLNNATAHYLLNMLYMTGAPVKNVRCRTFRAHDIETFDTAVVTGTSAGAKIFIAVTHANSADTLQDPMFEYTYEKAVLRYGGRGLKGGEVTAAFADGTVRRYGTVHSAYSQNLWNMADAIREGKPILCSGETALLQTQLLEEMRRLQPEAEPFREGCIRREGDALWVPGLAEKLWQCYEKEALP